MSETQDGSVADLIRQVRCDDPDGVAQLWNRFFPRLVALARATLQNHPQRASDAEDAALSAFMSFWTRMESSELLDSIDGNHLWNLMATITRRKSIKQIRREMAKKRGAGRVLTETDLTDDEGGQLVIDQCFSALPVAGLDVHCEELLQVLPDHARGFVLLRLAGYENKEIAQIMTCTVRKVERKLQLIRRIWSEGLDDEE